MPSRSDALILIAACIALFLPAFYFGAGGVDLQQQSLWVKHFSAQFWHGDVYPRWLQGMNGGDGSPAFFYYPPLPYFITSFFAFLLPLDPFGYTAIAASALLSFVISGFAFYALARQENAPAGAALLGSLLYIAAPNHLAQNFYYSLLFGSVWAAAWVPLLLLFFRRVTAGKPYAVIGFAVAFALLILSNMPLSILFIPLALAYGALFLSRGQWRWQVAQMALALALGAGLSACYLLPGFLYTGYANLDMYWSTNVPFVRFFMNLSDFRNSAHGIETLTTGYGIVMRDLNRLLYQIYWIASAIVLFCAWRAAPASRQRMLLLVAGVVALLLMLPVTAVLWNHVLPIEILQLSERLFALTTVCITLLMVYAWPRMKMAAYGIVAVSCMAAVLIGYGKHTTLAEFKATHRLQYTAFSMQVEQYAGFLPTPDLMGRYGTLEGLATLKQESAQVHAVSGDAVTEVRIWQPRNIVFHYRASQPSVVEVRQLDFAGYRALLAGSDLDVRRDNTTGRVLLDLPAGEGDVTVQLTALLPEIAGDGISLLSVAMLVLLLLFELRKNRELQLHTVR